MKTYLFSIHPKWCEKIFSGEKTIEVRKTAPKPPFKVVVYCTKGEKLYLDYEGMIKWSGGYHINENNSADNYNDQLLNGKVIGEFVCNEADTIINLGNAFEIKDKDKAYTNTVARNSCLDFYDLQKYLKNKNGCAIHITDTILYDKPRELGEFKKCDGFIDCLTCKKFKGSENATKCNRNIIHAPQSYMRIQDI